jgi:hypothetical protein
MRVEGVMSSWRGTTKGGRHNCPLRLIGTHKPGHWRCHRVCYHQGGGRTTQCAQPCTLKGLHPSLPPYLPCSACPGTSGSDPGTGSHPWPWGGKGRRERSRSEQRAGLSCTAASACSKAGGMPTLPVHPLTCTARPHPRPGHPALRWSCRR